MSVINELSIAVVHSQLRNTRERLVELCRKRGYQYADLDTTYTDNEGFVVIDGYRINRNEINDETVDMVGEPIAYVDSYSGRVVYINPDARWDDRCKELINSVSEQIKREHPVNVSDLEEDILRLCSALSVEQLNQAGLSSATINFIINNRMNGRKV